MEGHLHDTMASFVSSNLSTEEAFLLATRRLGSVDALAFEFARENPERVWRNRGFWMLAGVFLGINLLELTRTASFLGTSMLLSAASSSNSANMAIAAQFGALLSETIAILVAGGLLCTNQGLNVVGTWAQHRYQSRRRFILDLFGLTIFVTSLALASPFLQMTLSTGGNWRDVKFLWPWWWREIPVLVHLLPAVFLVLLYPDPKSANLSANECRSRVDV